MKLDQPSKILKEQLKGAPAWFLNAVLPSINMMLQDLYQALAGNIDDSNITSHTQQTTFTTLSTYPTDFTPIKFKSTLKIDPSGLQIQQCINRSTATGIATYNPGWNNNNGTIVVNEILGLAASTTYTITFRLT